MKKLINWYKSLEPRTREFIFAITVFIGTLLLFIVAMLCTNGG
jgi:hypothetical protein